MCVATRLTLLVGLYYLVIAVSINHAWVLLCARVRGFQFYTFKNCVG